MSKSTHNMKINPEATMTDLPDDLVYRLRKRAEIRRAIPRPEPDRISDICEEAANEIDVLRQRAEALAEQLAERDKHIELLCERLPNAGCHRHSEHTATPDCWCEPELDYVAPDGTKVWKHRETQ